MKTLWRKRLLAAVRGADYAHAGEEEAISMAMAPFETDAGRKILDVGCGMGGTAKWLSANGFGVPSGIDMDPAMIGHGKATYPGLDFHECEALDVLTCFASQKFDLICSFNAFFCFAEQGECLSVMSQVAAPSGQLVIFDYSSPSEYVGDPIFYSEPNLSAFSPINMSRIGQQLAQHGWHLEKTEDLSSHFLRWYQTLTQKMQSRRDELSRDFGADTYEELHEAYRKLIDSMEKGTIGGAIVRARVNAAS